MLGKTITGLRTATATVQPNDHTSPAFVSSTMDSHQDSHHRRVPTLIQLCQRAAISQVDSICGLGDDLTYPLVKPILERCTVEQLLRFENLSPHLQEDTPELWKDLCFRKYRLTAEERYSFDDDPQEPESWKSRFFALQDAEAKRIDELGSKLRTQRMEADERKKEKEVKYTDRVHCEKRPRTGWNTAVQPKTLFQKTKSDASKVQRAYYNTRVLPPMPTAKNYRVLPQSPGASLPPVAFSTVRSRVTVNTVIRRRPLDATSNPTASTSSLASTGIPMSTLTSPPHHPSPTDIPNQQSASNRPRAPSTNGPRPRLLAESPRPVTNFSTPVKKDPMASLFVPKRKVPPQRST